MRSKLLAAAFAVGLLGPLLDLAVLDGGVPDPRDDTWEYGVAARHLLAGSGFRTSVVHPPLLGLRSGPDASVPLLVHGPLLPALMAPPVALWGDRAVMGVGWLGAAFLALALLPIVRLARAVSGAETAALAVALLPWTPLVWRALNHDAVLLVGMAAFAASLDAALGAAPRPGRAGLACGLCYLARPEALLLAPWVAGTAGLRARAQGGSALRAAALFGTGFVACALPWWVHHHLAVGQPLFNLSAYMMASYWPPYHGISAMLDPGLTPERWAREAPGLLAGLPRKMVAFLPHAAKLAALQPAAWAAPLAGLGLVLTARRRPDFAAFAVATLATLVLLMSATVYDARYLALGMPFLCVLAAEGALGAARALSRRRAGWIAAAALAAAAVPPALGEAGTGGPAARAALAREAEALERRFAGESPVVLVTDIPDFASWRTGWPAVWADPRLAPRQLGATLLAAERWARRHPRLSGVALWLPGTAGRRDALPQPPHGPSPPAATARPGEFHHHAILDSLLRRHVRSGEVDYEGLRADRARLAAYLHALAAADTTAWPREEQIAFWINAYNACTLAGVLDYGPFDSVLDFGRVAGVPTGAFFRLRFEVAGRSLRLDDIEHRILRERFAEPRIHFAIVCASRSCPELADQAYRGDGLEARLDRATRAFLLDPARNRIPSGGGTLELSSIFKWFRKDFERDAGSLHAFLRRHLPPERAADVRDGARVRHLPYDWSLNGKRR